MTRIVEGLEDRPFNAMPDVRRYFPAEAIEEARQTLAGSIERGSGPGLAIGPAGCGKSMLCHVLAELFRHQLAVVHLSSARIQNSRALLQAILFELGLEYRKRDEGELRLELIGYLSRSDKCPEGILLIVDEAHTLPVRVLEELRMLSNLVRGGVPRVRIVLAGGPALEERFTHPKLESFNQRIAARTYLRAWDRAETEQYIAGELEAVGVESASVFSPGAVDRIYRATDGIPRLVVQLCDYALTLAIAGGRQSIDAEGIDEAWADLQQLPAPWNESARPTKPSESGQPSIIEFGALDSSAADEDTAEDVSPSVASFEVGSQPTATDNQPADATAMAHSLPDPDMPPAEDPLESLTAGVSALEEEFGAPGSIAPQRAAKPEFDATSVNAPGDAEAFEDEEVIIDRYAALDAGSGRSAVSPVQGDARALSDMFALHRGGGDGDSADGDLVDASLSTTDAVGHSATIAMNSTPADTTSMSSQATEWLDPSADPVMPTFDSLDALGPLRSERPPQVGPGTSAQGQTDIAAPAEETAPPLIVIDDTPAPGSASSSSEAQGARVERQDYSQLLERLRNG